MFKNKDPKEYLFEQLYKFLEKYSPIPPNLLIIYGLVVFLVSITIWLWIYSIKGIKNKVIIAGAKGISKVFTGKEAIRVGIYYLFMAIIITLYLINEFFIDASFAFDPFRIFLKDNCVFGCK